MFLHSHCNYIEWNVISMYILFSYLTVLPRNPCGWVKTTPDWPRQ